MGILPMGLTGVSGRVGSAHHLSNGEVYWLLPHIRRVVGRAHPTADARSMSLAQTNTSPLSWEHSNLALLSWKSPPSWGVTHPDGFGIMRT